QWSNVALDVWERIKLRKQKKVDAEPVPVEVKEKAVQRSRSFS
ncbi:DUF948 domain-containing protein, partial [Priestia megaterium]